VKAFAKINVDLRVVGRLAGGYHELRTTFQSIALHDTLTFTPIGRAGIEIACDDPACPTDQTNLVWKAAELVRRAARTRSGVRVTISKRIPMQAGLGGGSGDAAAALRACARVWRVETRKLPAMAAALGADVPFFLRGGTALGLGRGDLIRSLSDRPSSWVLLVLPDFGVSTREAYGWWDEEQFDRNVVSGFPSADLRTGSRTHNDLQAPVVARHPRIGAIVEALSRAGAFRAAMSGSGSAVFGLFKTRKGAERAAAAIGGGRERAIVTRTLDRAKYRAFSRPGDLPPGEPLV
jgi:4-diphosphocytidyl-2-C-methyl-D-erythritol kinase